MSMHKIKYRIVYNRKKVLNKKGEALIQIEAYLDKRKVYFSTHIYISPEQWNTQKRIIHRHSPAWTARRRHREWRDPP